MQDCLKGQSWEPDHHLLLGAPPSVLGPSGGHGGPWGTDMGLSAGAEAPLPVPCHLTAPPFLLREKAPKEKPKQQALRQPRQGPTDEAQMAAAAALARLEQKQPKARGPTSQDSIRNQGEPPLSSSHSWGVWGRQGQPLPFHPRG